MAFDHDDHEDGVKPSPRPQTHDLDQYRHSLYGFTRLGVTRPNQLGPGGDHRGTVEAYHSDHCEG